MWHITMKVVDKLPMELKRSTEFKRRFDDVVWCESDEPEEFEERWTAAMEEFDLVGHKWFDSMYECRRFWIPAFFRDVEMSGLFRTTSLSESENSFFRRYMNWNADLAQFYLHFENAIKSQRNSHDQCNYSDDTRFPDMETESPIEHHAAEVYTNKIFLSVQSEIKKSINDCIVTMTGCSNGGKTFSVDHEGNDIFEVSYDVTDDQLSCSCKYFIKHGQLCSHMFAAMRHLRIKAIPEKHIPRRWAKLACADLVRGASHISGLDTITAVINNLFVAACRCISLVDGNEQLMEKLLGQFNELGDSLVSSVGESTAAEIKKKKFEKFYGSKIPSKVTYFPPDTVIRNKGCGTRFKSIKEKESDRKKKAPRRRHLFEHMVGVGWSQLYYDRFTHQMPL